jgi:hypothetical protein
LAGFRRLRFSFFADEHAPGAALVLIICCKQMLASRFPILFKEKR